MNGDVVSWSQRMQGVAARRMVASRLPERIVRQPKSYRGATLDPQIQVILRLAELAGRGGIETMSPAHARREYDTAVGHLFDVAPLSLPSVVDEVIAGVPCRRYRPSADERPTLMFIHGGGFVVGSLDGYDAVCRYYARSIDCDVVSVGYRLAPEHPFPAAVDDVCAVFDALKPQALLGDSAGGNLSAVVAQHARDQGGHQPALQALIYPSTNSRRPTPSREDLDSGYGLTGPLMDWFRNHYAGPPDDPRVSPACGRVEGVCPALIYTCGFDPLRDEGESYAKQLEAAGVPVQFRCYETLIHGAFTMGGCVRAAKSMLQDVADALIISMRTHSSR